MVLKTRNGGGSEKAELGQKAARCFPFIDLQFIDTGLKTAYIN